MKILHLSDLHFQGPSQAQVWYNQLAEDLTRELRCRQLDGLIISGDVANLSENKEYDAAVVFINKVAKEFGFDNDRIIIVPGNHDLNWEVSQSSYKRRSKNGYLGPRDEDNVFIKGRYVWQKDRRVSLSRFKYFRRFHKRVTGSIYPLEYDAQFTIKFIVEMNLLILGLNSAWHTDHFYKSRCDIHPVALGNALTEIRSSPSYREASKIAVWHHPLHSESEDRIKDSAFMEQLAKAGFRLVLHGHIHKAETNLFRYDQTAEGRQIEIVSAGTFGAPTRELTSAYPWQYNLLTFENAELRVDTRRRERENGAWKPDSRWVSIVGKDPLPFYKINFGKKVGSKRANRKKRVDWEKSPDGSSFYGRQDEITEITKWVIKDRSRLIGIWGMGGIGKTGLAKKVGMTLRRRFDFVIWRSLVNAPPIDQLMDEVIGFISEQRATTGSLSFEEKLSGLISYMKEQRCLIILDNFDALFQEGLQAGHYRDGFELYGELIKQLAAVEHKSCVLLTSREAPREFSFLADAPFVHSRTILGLDSRDVRLILHGRKLTGKSTDWKEFIERFSGNPQFLKIVSSHVSQVFGGHISAFLKEEHATLGEPQSYFNSLFLRLPPVEKEIMFWLAIEREPMRHDVLLSRILHPYGRAELLSALESLRNRFLIDWVRDGFALQNVIIEYVTEFLCDSIAKDIINGRHDVLNRHALIVAQANDHVRDVQVRLIVKPIATRVLQLMGNEGSLSANFETILEDMRQKPSHQQGYSAGNIINLLAFMRADFSRYNFASLTIRQAHLQDIELHNVDFTGSTFRDCVFLDTFGGVLAIAIGKSGKILASGDANGEIRFWNIRDARVQSVSRAHTDWVRSLVFAPGGQNLFSSSDDQTIKLWDFVTNQCLGVYVGHRGRVRSISLSPNGRILVSGGDDRMIRWWNTRTGDCFRTSVGHSDQVRAVAFSPDGMTLATSAEDKTICIWNVVTGELMNTFREHTQGVCSLAFTSDGLYLASGSEDNTAILWHVESGRSVQVFRGHSRWIWSVAISKNDEFLATGSGDHTIKLWSVTSGECIKTLIGHTNWLRSTAFATDGKYLFSGSDDRTIRMWDPVDGTCLRTFQGYTGWIYCAEFSRDGSMLAFGSEDRTVKVWEIGKRTPHRTLAGHTDWIWSVAFSPDGRLLASASGDQTVRLWHIKDNEPPSTLRGHLGQVRSVTFSSDGRLLASGSDDRTIRIWDLESGNCRAILSGHTSQVWALAFSPDGQLLASGSDDLTIKLWDLRTNSNVGTLRGHQRRILSIAFSSDGKRMLTGSEDQTLRLWNVKSQRTLLTLKSHTSFVQSVSFSQNNKLIGSADTETVRIWDAKTGECKQIKPLPTDRVRALIPTSPEGFTTCGNRKGTIEVWDVLGGRQIAKAKAVRPYEGMIITRVIGLTEVQKRNLKELGAVET
jgi:WD40 repeat protein/predicted phosphodiesterase